MGKQNKWRIMQKAYNLLTQLNMKESNHLEDQGMDGIMA